MSTPPEQQPWPAAYPPPDPWAAPAPAVPAAGEPSRMRMGAFLAGLAATALVAGVIGVSVAGGDPSGSRATVTGDGKALFNRVLAPPPEAVEVTDENGGDSGVFTLDQFTQGYFKDPTTAAQGLSGLDFQWMAQRSWVGPDGIRVDDQLVQFATTDDAETYLGEELRGYQDDAEIGQHFAVDAVEGTGFEAGGLDEDGSRHAYLFAARGNVVVVVLIYAPAQFNRAEESGVLTGQIAVLPR